MAGKDFATDMIIAAGGKPTPQAVAALRAWQRWEGGSTANKATYNWLNRTDQGYPTINSVGVAAYPDYQTGISRTVDLIKSGYPSVYNAMRSGQFNFQDPGVQGDMNRWLSGKRTPGMTPYVSKIAATAGQNPGPLADVGQMPVQGGGTTARPMTTTQFAGLGTPQDISSMLMQSTQIKDPKQQTMALMGALLAAGHQSMPQAQSPAGGPPPQAGIPGVAAPGASYAHPDNELITSQGWKPSHVTDGLGWGTKSAVDMMASPGTPIGAPEPGKIVRYGSAQGGQSMYYQGDSGKMYWLGHIKQTVPAGTRWQKDQPIAVVSSDHKAPHLHIDVRG